MDIPERILTKINEDDGWGEYVKALEGEDELTPAPELNPDDLPF
jgi:hypothetical protein